VSIFLRVEDAGRLVQLEHPERMDFELGLLAVGLTLCLEPLSHRHSEVLLSGGVGLLVVSQHVAVGGPFCDEGRHL